MPRGQPILTVMGPPGRVVPLILAAGLVLAGALAGALALAERGVAAVAAAAGQGRTLAGRTVAIDAGHGGFDGGVYHGPLVEKDLNLDVALRLKEEVERRGAKAVLTREEDVAFADENRADLEHRLRMAHEVKADVLVSVHCNSFPDPSQFGAQTFYPARSPEARRLALLIQEELVRLQPENYREALEAAELYILKNSRVPAVLVEVGFISNPGDRQRLASPEYRARLAAAMASGLERFFAAARPGS